MEVIEFNLFISVAAVSCAPDSINLAYSFKVLPRPNVTNHLNLERQPCCPHVAFYGKMVIDKECA